MATLEQLTTKHSSEPHKLLSFIKFVILLHGNKQ